MNTKVSFELIILCIFLSLSFFTLSASCTTGNTEEFTWHEVGEQGEPPFLNGWGNSVGTAYETCGFGIDSMGFVHLKGMITDASYGAYNTIFYLPEGYWPENTNLFTAYSPTGSDDTGSILVYYNGSIALNDPGISEGTSAAVCLDGIIFFAEQ